jgi:hypothetical protein
LARRPRHGRRLRPSDGRVPSPPAVWPSRTSTKYSVWESRGTKHYLVVNTSQAGETTVYQAGRFLDQVVQTPDGLRFKQKRCTYDTLRVQIPLAYPI